MKPNRRHNRRSSNPKNGLTNEQENNSFSNMVDIMMEREKVDLEEAIKRVWFVLFCIELDNLILPDDIILIDSLGRVPSIHHKNVPPCKYKYTKPKHS